MEGTGPGIAEIRADAYRIPTDGPEQDGTLSWDSTTLVVVHARAGDRIGLGYTYADRAAADLIRTKLSEAVAGGDALSPEARWGDMMRAVRNLGEQGISAMAISAVDLALWDLKARLLDLPLCRLLGQVRPETDVYGSGGFTNYDDGKLRRQLSGWVESGISRVKMKVGAQPARDPERVRIARDAIGPQAGLFVDANGAYTLQQALAMAERFAECSVTWFEEPLPHWDLEGSCALLERMPSGMDLAGGEYGYLPGQFLRMLSGRSLSFLQADITRCGGLTGFLKVSALAEAFNIPLSSHCAPSLHIAAGCALAPFRHMEWFHDHVRIEEMLFDGFRRPERGRVRPDLGRPGLGLEFKGADAERFAI